MGRTVFLSWSPPANGPAVMNYTVAVVGAYVGSFTTPGRTLSGVAALGSYTLSVAARNVCGAGPSTATQTVIVH